MVVVVFLLVVLCVVVVGGSLCFLLLFFGGGGLGGGGGGRFLVPFPHSSYSFDFLSHIHRAVFSSKSPTSKENKQKL